MFCLLKNAKTQNVLGHLGHSRPAVHCEKVIPLAPTGVLERFGQLLFHLF